jgi:hypothetical protein
MTRFLRFASIALGIGLIVFCIALAMPILGVHVAFGLSGALGCSLPNWGGACALHGFLVDRLAVYNAFPVANLIGTPLIFAYAFWDVVLGWLVMIVATAILARMSSRDPRG